MARTDDPHPLIRRLRAIGMTDEVIFSRLLLEGWAAEDIRHAFDDRLVVPEMTQAAAPALVAHPPAPPAPIVLPAATSTTIPTIKAEHHYSMQAIEQEIAQAATRKRFSATTLTVAVFFAIAIGASMYVYFKPPSVYSFTLSTAEADASSSPPLSYGALPALSEPDYYASVKQKLVVQQISFIDANLSTMTLNVYKDGVLALAIPIAAKGKVGSWWETPAGIYKIETKEKDHFSSMGHVSMPYSLDFQGNFFIHGWPVYPDGTPVDTSYSGGCIRLNTDDAAKVYDLAEVGMPVVVYNEVSPSDPFSYALKAPSISASEYLVADIDSGTVLTEKNAGDQAPVASITKLVTALVATEYINLDVEVNVPSEALVYTTVPRLRAGESIKAYDLLFLLLQESSNEAAETLADDRGRDQFIDYMNAKAKAIGLDNTSLNDPSGAKDDLSTPEDLFKLLKYIYDNRRFVFGITTGDITDSAYGKPAFGPLRNFNIIKNTPATLLGGKVGETNDAGETYAGIFDVKVGDADRHLAVIVLGAKDSPSDVAKLLNFVHNSYASAQ